MMNRLSGWLASTTLVITACTGAAPDTGSGHEHALASESEIQAAVPPLFANAGDGKCHYPIVLEHGFAASNESSSPWAFVGEDRDLMAAGHALVVADEVQPMAGVTARAETMARSLAAVAEQCRAIPGCDPTGVHVIAHSYGGLHAREYLRLHPPANAASDGLPRVVSLTTIASPNHGTGVADWALSIIHSGGEITEALADLVSRLLGRVITSAELASNPDIEDALWAQSEANADAFGAAHPAVSDVRYFAWAAVSLTPNLLANPFHPERVSGEFPAECDGKVFAYRDANGVVHGFATQFPLLIAHEETGHHGLYPNDGMATVTSAKALPGSEFMGCIPSDHLAEVGHSSQANIDWSGFDARAFYRDIAANLASIE